MARLVELAHFLNFHFIDHFKFFVHISVSVFQFSDLGVELSFFDLLYGLVISYAFQEVAIFVHVKCHVVVRYCLDLLNRTQVLLDVNFEIASHPILDDFPVVGGVCTQFMLHIPEVASLLEVLVQFVLCLDPTKESLDSLALLLNVETAQFVLVCAGKFLSQVKR